MGKIIHIKKGDIFNNLKVVGQFQEGYVRWVKCKHIIHGGICNVRLHNIFRNSHCGGIDVTQGKVKRGERYKKLVAAKYAGVLEPSKAMWECICDCGNVTTVLAGSLRSGQTGSCGCSRRRKALGKPRFRVALWDKFLNYIRS